MKTLNRQLAHAFILDSNILLGIKVASKNNKKIYFLLKLAFLLFVLNV